MDSIYPVTKAEIFLKEVKKITRHMYAIYDCEFLIKETNPMGSDLKNLLNKIGEEKSSVVKLMRELPFLSQEDLDGMEGWIRSEILEYRICPYCHGSIGCYPRTEYNYEISCETCGEIFDEN